MFDFMKNMIILHKDSMSFQLVHVFGCYLNIMRNLRKKGDIPKIIQ